MTAENAQGVGPNRRIKLILAQIPEMYNRPVLGQHNCPSED